ncbi:PREDICTED: endonuclease V [Condylura cristata]|uniref:endonuclease V n=1 Tax=Condylura cristata TaxID=143302 RepID=UPI0006438048|nr:PREDICTED: endonuclease V [Condylura cristata]
MSGDVPTSGADEAPGRPKPTPEHPARRSRGLVRRGLLERPWHPRSKRELVTTAATPALDASKSRRSLRDPCGGFLLPAGLDARVWPGRRLALPSPTHPCPPGAPGPAWSPRRCSRLSSPGGASALCLCPAQLREPLFLWSAVRVPARRVGLRRREVLYEDSRLVSLTAPYVSGFLGFREAPFLADAVQRLREREPQLLPQVLLVDGNGVLHPRGFGVACHLGVLTDLPCVGVAKKLLQVDGLENNALHRERIRSLRAGGDTFALTGRSGAVLGMALRSHARSTKPLYVSVGHRTSLEAAVRLTRGCCRFRIPEPVRQADIRSRDFIRRSLGSPGPARARSQKPQRPKASPKGDSEEPAGNGGPPAAQ